MGWKFSAASRSLLTTKGDLHTYDTDDVRLPVATPGHVLTLDPAQAKGMKWAAAGGGGRTLIDSDVLTGTGAISLTGISGGYTDLELVVEGRTDAAFNGEDLFMRVGDGSFDTGTNYAWIFTVAGDSPSTEQAAGDTNIGDGASTGAPWTAANADTDRYGLLVATFYNYADTAEERFIRLKGFRRATTTNIRSLDGWGFWDNEADPISRIQLNGQVGDLVAGSRWWLYGIT